MNLIFYIMGLMHFFGAITIIFGAAEGFVAAERPQMPSWNEVREADIVFVGLFLYSWYHQYKSNLILVNLRKDNSGNLITEKHLMPSGGYFGLISAPHTFFEILLYFSLFGLLRTATSAYLFAKVLLSQIYMGCMAHGWYKETFKDYPKMRKAVIPYLI